MAIRKTETTSGYPSRPVLVVDDEIHSLQSIDITLRSAGIDNLILCSEPARVADIVSREEPELVLLDLVMPQVSGQQVLAFLKHEYHDLPVIMVSAVNEAGTVVECVKSGAYDYVTKPLDSDRLITLVRRAVEARELMRENQRLKSGIMGSGYGSDEAFARIVTRSRKMHSIFQYCDAIAEGSYPVLITGETGTGKELISEAVHVLSNRSGDFVPVNVAGLDDNMFSDTLFGHVKGAFTGAANSRPGLVEKAGAGTLFLDEIGDLDSESQIKLLRLLDRREYYPLGSDMPRPTEARIIVATQVDMAAAIENGDFRNDLYYRLRNHHIHIPPLRERSEDIPLLLELFVDEAAAEFGRPRPEVSPEVYAVLKAYSFPGNVRELRSIVLDAVGRNTDTATLGVDNFRPYLGDSAHLQFSEQPGGDDDLFVSLEVLPTLKESANALVAEALRRTDNNQRAAARLLGISPQALNQRLKRNDN